MKLLLVICILLSLAFPLLANEPSGYPGVVINFDSLKFKLVSQSELPDGVYFWISQCLESNYDPAFKGKISYIDLNGDGIREILVESACKLENQYEFWQIRDGRWISLLTIWGKPNFLKKKNGYYQITTWNENRRGDSIRALYTYEGKRFHINRIDKYQGNFDQNDKYQGSSYVGPQNKKDREEVLEINFSQQFPYPNSEPVRPVGTR